MLKNDIQGFPQVFRTWGGEGGELSKCDGAGLKSIHEGAWGDENAVENYLWRSSFDSKVAGYKPASL